MAGKKLSQDANTARGKSAQTFMERMATLTDVFVGADGLTSLPPFTDYLSMPEGYKAPGGASQNYKSMGRFSRYVYELMTEGPELAKFRKQALNYFAEEMKTGQMITEQGCSVPHDGMHIARALLARLASIVYGDDAMEAASREWLAGFLAMCKACSDSNGHVCWPGFRVKKDPVSQVRDMVYHAATFGSVPSRISGEKLNKDRFFLGARLAYLLSELPGGLPDPAPALPKLWALMTVQRFPGGYLAWIEEPAKLDGKGRKEAVDWVLSSSDGLEFGRSWLAPVPKVANVTETLRSEERS
jgi:hypothetical protein